MLRLIGANLGRRPARTLLTATGIAVGVATIVALLALSAGLQRSAAGLIELGAAEMGLFQDGVADLTASSLPETLVPRAKAVPGVKDASPVAILTEPMNGFSLLVFGVEPGSFVARRQIVVAGRPARPDELMLGTGAARRMNAGPGDTVSVHGRSLRVAGIYHAGAAFEDNGAVLGIDEMRAISGRSGETTIALALEPTYSTDRVRRSLESALPGTVAISDPGEAARADTNSLLIGRAVLVIAVLAIAIGAISVMNTMLMSVVEREGELGLLAAVGWSPRQIGRLILGESVGVSVLGALLGVGLGLIGGTLAVRALAASTIVQPQFTAWGIGRGLLVGVAIGIAGGLYPAWRVRRLSPARALARA